MKIWKSHCSCDTHMFRAVWVRSVEEIYSKCSFRMWRKEWGKVQKIQMHSMVFFEGHEDTKLLTINRLITHQHQHHDQEQQHSNSFSYDCVYLHYRFRSWAQGLVAWPYAMLIAQCSLLCWDWDMFSAFTQLFIRFD